MRLEAKSLQSIPSVELFKGQPHAFRCHGKRYLVNEVLETWRETGAWWSGEEETWWWRVQTSDLGIFEIGWRPADKTWWMGRKWD